MPDITFLSGGTGGSLRRVSISKVELLSQIEDTAETLGLLGVSTKSLVVVGVPSLPWAVGHVMLASVLRIGGSVHALGLMAWNDAVLGEGLLPHVTHVILPPNHLLRLSRSHPRSLSGRVAIVLGEHLAERDEQEILVNCPSVTIRRVYGTTECGTIGVQLAQSSRWLDVVPSLSVQLSEGVLFVRRHRIDDSPWIPTGDYAEIRRGGEFSSWQVRLGHRNDGALILIDGSRIYPHHVQKFGAMIGGTAQVLSGNSDGSTLVVRVWCDGPRQSHAEVVDLMRKAVPEIDEPSAHAALRWQVVHCDSEDELRNERGKIVPLVCYEDARVTLAELARR